MSSGNRERVKVVIINTEYVETDAESFKSVVQKLTGKDAMVGGEMLKSRRQRRDTERVKVSGCNNSVMDTGLSFKDLDRWFMELPPLDELYPSWRD